MRALYGQSSYSALQRVWDELEPRYVEVTLVQGRGLPAAQSNTYCVFYLVKPCRAVLAELAAEGAQVSTASAAVECYCVALLVVTAATLLQVLRHIEPACRSCS
jgi:hypothetical protein